MRSPARAKALPHTDAPRPAPAKTMPTPTGARPTKTEQPQRFPQREPHPITIMSPTRSGHDALPIYTDAPRPAPAKTMPTPTGARPTKTEQPQRFPQREPHPITIMSPTRRPARSRTEISMGARAHKSDHPRPHNHSPPTSPNRT